MRAFRPNGAADRAPVHQNVARLSAMVHAELGLGKWPTLDPSTYTVVKALFDTALGRFNAVDHERVRDEHLFVALEDMKGGKGGERGNSARRCNAVDPQIHPDRILRRADRQVPQPAGCRQALKRDLGDVDGTACRGGARRS